MIEMIELISGENKRPEFNGTISEGVVALQALVSLYKNAPEEMIDKLKSETWQKK